VIIRPRSRLRPGWILAFALLGVSLALKGERGLTGIFWAVLAGLLWR
jgi:hypothetical protein